MPNNYYERLSEMNPGELADGLAIEQEFDAIGRGFSKLPAPHRDGHGFEGPTRVGEPVEETDAVNLGSLEKLNLPIYRKKITNEDWNSITDAGVYDVVDASGANKPPAYLYGVLIVRKFNGVVTQEYYPDTSGKAILLRRSCADLNQPVWVAWDGALSYSNIVGTVSQSGGAPAGSIIERGSNANGEYVKFADGTMICTRHFQRSFNGQYDATLVFPAPFINSLYGVSHMYEDANACTVSISRSNDRAVITAKSHLGGNGVLAFTNTFTIFGRWY
ncbi:pyocin knob domain-containing protein [Aeromonas veronii]